jgi:hypothetical protein
VLTEQVDEGDAVFPPLSSRPTLLCRLRGSKSIGAGRQAFARRICSRRCARH